MQTNYKEVFQLAQDKGFIRPYNFHNYAVTGSKDYTIADSAISLLWLTLIQRWLRDEHKIFVNVFPYDAEDFAKAVYGVNIINIEWGMYKECHVEKMLRTYPPSYEEALLNGINEALKLI